MSDAHPFAAIAGTWRGSGHGEYPTIADFEYHEELVIAPVPTRPVAHWRSTTRDAVSGEPRHAESGFLRATGDTIEFVVAHSFGIVEVATGSFADEVLALDALTMNGTPTAKSVVGVQRRYGFHGDHLRYTVSMAAVGEAMTHHLGADLTRSTST